MKNSTGWNQWERTSGVCLERWTNVGIRLAYVATYLGTAFVSPALIVAGCHASVSHKLTAQLQVLSGGDKGTIRPRPKQVLIVAQERQPTNNLNGNGISNFLIMFKPSNTCVVETRVHSTLYSLSPLVRRKKSEDSILPGTGLIAFGKFVQCLLVTYTYFLLHAA